jgi:extradiol dioxygenase family protein
LIIKKGIMKNTNLSPFHLAVPVRDLNETRQFYREILGCEEGRSSDTWVDFNFFGHQFVIHLKAEYFDGRDPKSNPVDGHNVPVPHFGLVLGWEEWEALAERLKENGIKFEIEPYIRFKGKVGEQATMFFLDPSGNALEFKAFKDMGQLFAK